MVWDVAASAISGGLALSLIYIGVAVQGAAREHGDDRFHAGWIVALAGVTIAAGILFLKTHG